MLEQLLKEALGMYERALVSGAAVDDPTWLWEELGLPADGIWSEPAPPRLGHESFAQQVEGSRELAEQVADQTRASTREHPERVIPRAELFADLRVRQLLRAHEGDDLREHCDAETGAQDHGLLAQWIELLCNLELFRRKIFWVSDELAWLLGATQIDVNGAALNLPFASFALVFTDRYSLGLAERMIAREPGARLRGRMLRCLTVYVTRTRGAGVRVALSCDALDGGWPLLMVRDVAIAPDAPLDEIVGAARPDADARGIATLADCASIEQLLRLVFNAILYATSADVFVETVEPRPATSQPPSRKRVFTSETVFRLPGTIDITAVRELKRARRGAHDVEVVRRCLVRGHWRRANSRWQDQRIRWIAPHWRGPSVAALVEREYRLR